MKAKLILKEMLNVNYFLKILAILLFATYLFRLFSEDQIDNVFNLLLVDVKTNIDAEDTWLFAVPTSLIILFLRWQTIIVLTMAIITSFKPTIWTRYIVGFFGTFIGILNILFFKSHLIAFYGTSMNGLGFRGVQFLIEILLLISITITTIVVVIKQKHQFRKKDLLIILLIGLGASLALIPQTIFYNLFGNYTEIPKDFTNSHLFLIILPIALIVIIYFIMRNKKQEYKDILLLFLAFAGVFQYFYMRRPGLAALPLHLCNTAVILLFFAVIFKIKSFFYFAYFANVLGAFVAIITPNYSTNLYTLTVVHFTYNHMYAFIIPILGVILGVFPKPSLTHMLKAVGVFSVYFIVVIFLNAWFNNFDTVDYFFSYSNFLTDMFGLTNLQYENVLVFEYKNLSFKFFWLFQLLLYLSFVFLMFVMWYLYDMFYQFVIQSSNLKDKQRLKRVDYLNLLEQLKGRSVSEPMNLGGIDMIKISNFSKKYGKSTKYAVNDFSLEVNRGEIFGFLGHNGAGKSTTIKSLVGIQSITEGEMQICGYSIKTQPLEAKLQIGYVSDNHAVYEKLTGREYIHYVARLYQVDSEQRDIRLNDLALRLSLDHALDQMVKSYSHGMKQKLVVIASLIHQPQVWILDEPLTGLDPISSFQIKEIMKKHANDGNIVFFSSHVIEVVEKICTKIAVITQGKLTGVYDVNELKEKNVSLEELYMIGVKEKLGVSHV